MDPARDDSTAPPSGANAAPSTFFSYWLGYDEAGTAPSFRPALVDTPAFVDIVAVAFGVPTSASGLDMSFLLSASDEATVKAGIKTLRDRGHRVVLSVNSADQTPEPWRSRDAKWAALDPSVFADSVANVCDEWGFDGLDLDNESPSDIPGTGFVQLIQAVRNRMGTGFHLSYPAYLPWRDAFLHDVRDVLDLVCTMAYWNDFDGQLSLFESYAAWVGTDKVAIGVKAGDKPVDQATPFDAVEPLAAYQPPGGRKAGMMFWSLSGDVESHTGKPAGTWARTIEAGLAKSSARSGAR